MKQEIKPVLNTEITDEEGRHPLKRADAIFEPLNERNYLFNNENSCCDVPIPDIAKMLEEMRFRLIWTSKDLSPLRYREMWSFYESLLEKAFFSELHKYPPVVLETERLEMEWADTVNDPELDPYKSQRRSNITNQMEYYVDRNKVPSAQNYDNVIQQYEKDWREALKKDLAESWMWKNYDTTPFDENIYCMGKLESRLVRIPHWMNATDKFHEAYFHLSTIEKVALAHAIHFTLDCSDYGYIECSGRVEMWCRCSVREAHRAFQLLYRKNLVDYVRVKPAACHNLTRNWGWRANILFIQNTLNNYGRKLDV